MNDDDDQNPSRVTDVSRASHYHEVLDRGFVRLVSYMGDDLLPARVARVSYGRESKGEEKDAALMDFLARHDHGGPFEFVEFMFHVKSPIFVARQWMRHRMAEYNEISGRYTQFQMDEHWVPNFSRVPSKYNKQGSNRPDFLAMRERWDPDTRKRIPDIGAWHDQVAHEIDICCRAAQETYDRLVNQYGVAPEIARTVLPLGTYTEFYCKMNFRSLANFIRLRTHEGAQKEIRDYARAMLEIVSSTHPRLADVLRRHWMDSDEE